MRVSHIPLPLARRARHSIAIQSLALVATLALTACINDYEDDLAIATTGLRVEMTLSTRSADIENAQNGGSTYFEDGTDAENYIDPTSVRVYFFTYNGEGQSGATGTESENGTCIAMLTPTSVTKNTGSDDYSYTVTGIVDKNITAETTGFRVAVCANWSTYPTEEDMATLTIDELCEYTPTDSGAANWSTYTYTSNNSTNFTPSSTGDHIPYFGIAAIQVSDSDDSGISWQEGAINDLGTIYLLKAMARIEVVYDYGGDGDLDDNSEPIGEVWLRRYNATGYCAPKGVYELSDYYTAKTGTQSDSDIWSHNYDQGGVHLLGGENDSDDSTDSKYVTFTRVVNGYTDSNNTTHDCWRAYVPEYSNQADNYSYIQIYWADEVTSGTIETTAGDHVVYFANYTDGSTNAYDQGTTATDGYYSGRIDIHRNYLYRFFVTRAPQDNDVSVTVYVQPWTANQPEEITVD